MALEVSNYLDDTQEIAELWTAPGRVLPAAALGFDRYPRAHLRPIAATENVQTLIL
jgi:hypothetical protein